MNPLLKREVFLPIMYLPYIRTSQQRKVPDNNFCHEPHPLEPCFNLLIAKPEPLKSITGNPIHAD